MTLTVKNLKSVLGWGALINYIVLTAWFLAFVYAHEWMYRVLNEWFDFSVQTFNTVQYLGMLFFDMGAFLFFLAPWVALLIATRRA